MIVGESVRLCQVRLAMIVGESVRFGSPVKITF